MGIGSSLPEGNRHFTWCTNTDCDIKLSCGRLKRTALPEGALEERFVGGVECEWYIIRDLLQKEGDVFRGAGHRKHNLHAPGGKTRKRATPEELGLKRPDLKVKRHIRMGFDINKTADPQPIDKEEDK